MTQVKIKSVLIRIFRRIEEYANVPILDIAIGTLKAVATQLRRGRPMFAMRSIDPRWLKLEEAGAARRIQGNRSKTGFVEPSFSGISDFYKLWRAAYKVLATRDAMPAPRAMQMSDATRTATTLVWLNPKALPHASRAAP